MILVEVSGEIGKQESNGGRLKLTVFASIGNVPCIRLDKVSPLRSSSYEH